MSQQKKEHRGPLVEAAYALEAEFAELDNLMQSAMRLPLVSQRNLERTGAALIELSKAEERISPKLSELLGALDKLRSSQGDAVEGLKERVQEFLARRETFEGLTARYSEILADGNRLSAMVQEFAGKHAKGSTPGESASAVESVKTIVDELGRLVAATEDLRKSAKDAEFAELAHETDGLRQQLTSARNKVAQVADQVSAGAAKA